MPKKYSCYVCSNNCKDYCIFCECCNTWSHYACQNIDRTTRAIWRSEENLPFLCIRCRCNDDGSFDYLMGLERLKKAAKQSKRKLELAAKSESMYIYLVQIDTGKTQADFSSPNRFTALQDETPYSDDEPNDTDKSNCGSDQVTLSDLDPALDAPEFDSTTIAECNDLSVIPEESDDLLDISREHPELKIEQNDEQIKPEFIPNEDEEPLQPEFIPGSLRSFMNYNSVIDIFREPHTVLKGIPVGRKDGMYFIIENDKKEFWDDCGAWNKSSCPKALFVHQQNKLTSVVLKNEQYCAEKTVKGKRLYIPLEPQPEKTSVLELQRTYQTLKASIDSNKFKRRLTTFVNIPETLPFLTDKHFLVEYVGSFPSRIMHGNVKYNEKNEVYIKTKKTVMDKLKNELQSQSVKEVQKTMNLDADDDYQKHRDVKQLYNIKYNLNKKDNTPSNTANQNEIISTNGLRKVITTPTAGKKPNQVKRKRAERARTPSSKRRLIE